jgi:hypothetical protein
MKQWEQIARERFILRKIPDHQGRPMYTEERLFTYLQQFERDFATSKAKIIDATEGGAAKRGTVVMKLAEVIDSLSPVLRGEGWGEGPLQSEISNLKSRIAEPLTPTLSPEYRGEGGRIDAVRACLRRREDEGRRIEEICRETLPLLEEIRDHVDDQPRVNKAIFAVDALRARMNELGATYDLVTQLTQSSELERFKADRAISAAKDLSEHERQKRQVTRDIGNAQAVADAAGDFQDLMRQTVDLLDRRRRHFSDGVPDRTPTQPPKREAA